MGNKVIVGKGSVRRESLGSTGEQRGPLCSSALFHPLILSGSCAVNILLYSCQRYVQSTRQQEPPKGSNSGWPCCSTARRKHCWTFLKENHHRNEFARSTHKDQRDFWVQSFPVPFSAVLYRRLFIFTGYKKKSCLALKTTER